MKLVFSDEYDKLTDEMRQLMEQAADKAFSLEFGEEISADGFDIDMIRTETGVTVVSDEEIRGLNREYRGNDRVTDVLSFPQFSCREELLSELTESAERVMASGGDHEADDETMPIPVTLTGDVVICCDQAMRQSEEYGTGLRREMLYLFVHSIMHLFGYDHEEEEEKRIMRAREEAVLSAIGIPGI